MSAPLQQSVTHAQDVEDAQVVVILDAISRTSNSHTNVGIHDSATTSVTSSSSCLTGLNAKSRLSTVPTSLVSLSIGSFLTSIDAHHFAQTSHRSLQQLQEYEFQQEASLDRMQSMNSSHLRSPISFGLVRHVLIAEHHLYHLPNLPATVRRVTISIRRDQQAENALYFYSQSETSSPSQFASRSANESPSTPSHVIILPATVVKLSFRPDDPYGYQRAAPAWLQHLRLHPNSRLQSMSINTALKFLPPLVRQLPDSVTELELPEQRMDRILTADDYPARWPPNLTRLKFLPFRQLPALPATITELDTYGVCTEPLFMQVPPNLKTIDWLVFECPRTATWRFPAHLTSLRLARFNEPFPLGFTFPPQLTDLQLPNFCLPFDQDFAFPATLTELRLPDYCHRELSLPASLISLTLGAPSKRKSKGVTSDAPYARIHWPASLRTLIFGTNVTGSLRGWTPPPNLTHLHTGRRWNLTLDHLPLPDTLLVLTLGDYYQSLVGIRFPPHLQEIRILGIHPASQISLKQGDWTPPPSLTAMQLQQWTANIYLPPTLKRFTLNSTNVGSLSEFKALPSGLLELDMTKFHYDSQIKTIVWPPNLRCLRLSQQFCIKLPRESLFPPSLQECWVTGTISRNRRQWFANTLPKDCALYLVDG